MGSSKLLILSADFEHLYLAAKKDLQSLTFTRHRNNITKRSILYVSI